VAGADPATRRAHSSRTDPRRQVPPRTAHGRPRSARGRSRPARTGSTAACRPEDQERRQRPHQGRHLDDGTRPEGRARGSLHPSSPTSSSPGRGGRAAARRRRPATWPTPPGRSAWTTPGARPSGHAGWRTRRPTARGGLGEAPAQARERGRGDDDGEEARRLDEPPPAGPTPRWPVGPGGRHSAPRRRVDLAGGCRSGAPPRCHAGASGPPRARW